MFEFSFARIAVSSHVLIVLGGRQNVISFVLPVLVFDQDSTPYFKHQTPVMLFAAHN